MFYESLLTGSAGRAELPQGVAGVIHDLAGRQKGPFPAGHSCKHQVPAGDLVGVTRRVVNRPLTDRTSAFGRVPGNRHRRVRVESVLWLAEERDRR